MSLLEKISHAYSFGGWQNRYQHESKTLGCTMQLSVFLPPQAKKKSVPVLYWLSGLTCTDENFVQKAGAQRIAAELGLAIVCPDTSPRGFDFEGEHDSYDFGSGAGFYLNATQAPWNKHYQMYDYITQELPLLLESELPLDSSKRGIFGHSMGGHGAITCALKNTNAYKSISAFAPICAPSQCPWGEKAFNGYLGEHKQDWLQYDSCELIKHSAANIPLLVDQGLADNFLDTQLNTKLLKEVTQQYNYPATIREHEHYDHSYFFIASFIEEHLRFHHQHLS